MNKSKVFLADRVRFIASIILLCCAFIFFTVIFIIYDDYDIINIIATIFVYLIGVLMLIASLTFIKISHIHLVYWGIFRKKKEIELKEVNKIEIGYSNRRRRGIEISIKGNGEIIKCILTEKIIKELSVQFDKKMFKLNIAHCRFGGKTFNVLLEIFCEEIL